MRCLQVASNGSPYIRCISEDMFKYSFLVPVNVIVHAVCYMVLEARIQNNYFLIKKTNYIIIIKAFDVTNMECKVHFAFANCLNYLYTWY